MQHHICTRHLKQELQLHLRPLTWAVKLLRAKLALCGHDPGNAGEDVEPRNHGKPMKLHTFCELLRILLGVASQHTLPSYSCLDLQSCQRVWCLICWLM